MSGGFSNLDQTSSKHTIVHIYLHESIHLLNANHKFCKLQVVLYTIVLVYIGFVSSYGITASCVFGWNCHDLLSALSEKYIRITYGRPTDPISQLSRRNVNCDYLLSRAILCVNITLPRDVRSGMILNVPLPCPIFRIS